MVAVIDGAVNASLSAIICLILLVSSDFNSSGVFAIITSSQSLSPSVSQEPVHAPEPPEGLCHGPEHHGCPRPRASR